MVQGNLSVAEFAVDFHTAAVDSGWNTTALYDAFFRRLSGEVKAPLPFCLDDFVALAM